MTAINFVEIEVGDLLPSRQYTATNVSLFMYNAAVWNPHRIHYDAEYTTSVEHHPGIVIDGPLQGDWLSQCALDWVADQGRLIHFAYSNRLASYLGETLTVSGVVTAVANAAREVSIDLFVKNQAGEVTSPGNGIIRFS